MAPACCGEGDELDPLTLAAKHPGRFPHLRHGAPLEVLQKGSWQHASKLLRWELLKGDFRAAIETANIPDLIFYDPFSYKTDADLWTAEVFARIFTRCLPKSAELYTYSASTAVRAALLATGFFVAQGAGTGPKSETTIAFTRAKGAADHPRLPQLLGHAWLKRWSRSGSQFPAHLSEAAKSRFETLIETHPQFSTASSEPEA